MLSQNGVIQLAGRPHFSRQFGPEYAQLDRDGLVIIIFGGVALGGGSLALGLQQSNDPTIQRTPLKYFQEMGTYY